MRPETSGGAVAIAAALFVVVASGASAQAPDLVKRGEYLFRAGICYSCHTDEKAGGKPLAGGLALVSPFGTFYSPNITPDPETGIGRWSDADFARAMRLGIRPDGAHYFPAFPYTTYTKMSDEDVAALKAYLFAQPPVHQPNLAHDIPPPFSWRFLQAGWKLLFFEPGPFKPDPAKSAEINRGAYLVEALAHCGECHTPRNPLGGLDRAKWLAGTPDGPEGERAPNITPDKETGAGSWSAVDLIEAMKTGTKPDYDNLQGTMYAAIAHGLKYLTEDDLKAIAAYLKDVPAIANKVPARKPKG